MNPNGRHFDVDGMRNASTVLRECGGYIGRSVDLTTVRVQCVCVELCICAAVRSARLALTQFCCNAGRIRNSSNGLSQFCDGAGACVFRNPNNLQVRSACWKHENMR
jgi:hypothetical protein